MVYGAEAVLPTDVEYDAPRVTMFTETEAKEAREENWLCLGLQFINKL